MINLKVTIKGDTVINRKLANMGIVIKDLRPVFGRFRKILVNEWADNFKKEGSYKGAWANLSERTNKDRIRKGYSPAHPILRRSGNLLAGVLGRNNNSINVMQKQRAEFGVKGSKAVYADEARNFITISNNTKESLIKVIQEALKKAVA